MARTIETVEGGGLVVLLLRTIDSLKQLHTIAMDVHARYRTEAHQDVVGACLSCFHLTSDSLLSPLSHLDEIPVFKLVINS